VQLSTTRRKGFRVISGVFWSTPNTGYAEFAATAFIIVIAYPMRDSRRHRRAGHASGMLERFLNFLLGCDFRAIVHS